MDEEARPSDATAVDAFAAGLVGAKHALSEGWKDAHLLVRASTPKTTFDPTNEKEKTWWTEQLASFARDLAALPIVDCTSQLLPATSPGGPCAHFVIPRLLPSSTTDETTVERLWPPVEACTELTRPRRELAVEWTGIADGWHSLGLDISRITVSSLAKRVRGGAGKLDALNLKDNKTEWLGKFLDIVGECWIKRSGVGLSVLTDLMPDQNRDLRPPSALHRDVGVSDALKDICRTIDHDVRGKLLLGDIEEIAAGKNLQYLAAAVKQAFPKSLSEDQVIEETVKHLDKDLPEDDECDQATKDLQHGAVLLLDYLWKSRGKNAAAIAEKVPLITSNGHAVRWSHNRMMMAPMRSWHKAAQPFAAAYPPHRVLADFFAGDNEKGVPDVVRVLVEFGMAIADPITSDTPAKLDGSRLNAISRQADTEGVVVSNQRFSQIALLHPDVLNRCQEGVEEARALLGLVLCHVAPHDPEWQHDRMTKGRKQRKEVELKVCGALWLADLKIRSWVPVPRDGKTVKMRADAQTLDDLLDPVWLKDNDPAIRLLSEWFEFDELELRLLGGCAGPEQAPRIAQPNRQTSRNGGCRSRILLVTGEPD